MQKLQVTRIHPHTGRIVAEDTVHEASLVVDLVEAEHRVQA